MNLVAAAVVQMESADQDQAAMVAMVVTGLHLLSVDLLLLMPAEVGVAPMLVAQEVPEVPEVVAAVTEPHLLLLDLLELITQVVEAVAHNT
jgi:hypothetical protein